jgi:hypothetical protein
MVQLFLVQNNNGYQCIKCINRIYKSIESCARTRVGSEVVGIAWLALAAMTWFWSYAV